MILSDRPRIPPADSPYGDAMGDELKRWMPPGAAVEPLNIFRTLVVNLPLAQAMRGLGSFILGRRLSLSVRERELIIDRTCARCGCEYEWGVHVAAFGRSAGLSDDDIVATAALGLAGSSLSERDLLILRLVDELHDTSAISDELWQSLVTHWTPAQLLEMMVVVGWYHTISYVANGVNMEREGWAATFPTPRS